jgi:hypothetical protein
MVPSAIVGRDGVALEHGLLQLCVVVGLAVGDGDDGVSRAFGTIADFHIEAPADVWLPGTQVPGV